MIRKINEVKHHQANIGYWNRSMSLNTEAEPTKISVKKNMYVNHRGGKTLVMKCGILYDAIVVFIVQREGNYKWKYIFTDERGIVCASSHLSAFSERKSDIRNNRIDDLLKN